MPAPPSIGGGTIECDGFQVNDGVENVFRQPVAIADPDTWANAAKVAAAALAGTEMALAVRSIDSPPNSAGTTSQTAVGASAVQISSVSPSANRRKIKVKNHSGSPGEIYIGFTSGVTTATGYRLDPGESDNFDFGPALTLWAIGAVAGNTAFVVEAG